MGVGYLCSRSELFRALELDRSSRPLFIGAPREFMTWFDKVLPMKTRVLSSIGKDAKNIRTDLVVLWISGEMTSPDEEFRKVRDAFAVKAPVFLIATDDVKNRLEKSGADIGAPNTRCAFPVSTELELLRIIVKEPPLQA
ncbi:MAG: hypothetical protein DRN57_01825 [Thermoplasmata archaeon]|nr:MAG: hypothetical protein DRN57_01825 [Thermoplasmata archaeon]